VNGTPKKIVLKVEEGMDPREIYCTTYQMRNVWQQIATAMITPLDVMSLSMHHAAAVMCRSKDKVLDVCCGRAMILPLIRRVRPNVLSYTGIDIHPQNYAEAYKYSAMSKIADYRFANNSPGQGEPWYPFAINFVEGDAADMYEQLTLAKLAPFDFIVYMASIEHMQKEAGIKSLVECYRVLRQGGRMLITSPNTTDKEDEYDTQYAAHLYEWSSEELKTECLNIGFQIQGEFGLLAKVTGYQDAMEEEYPELVPIYQQFAQWLPSAWLHAMFPIITPRIADETALLLTKK